VCDGWAPSHQVQRYREGNGDSLLACGVAGLNIRAKKALRWDEMNSSGKNFLAGDAARAKRVFF
jgi:hypothetical protein